MKYDVDYTPEAENVFHALVARYEQYLDIYTELLMRAQEEPNTLRPWHSSKNPNRVYIASKCCWDMVITFIKDDQRKQLTVVDIKITPDNECIDRLPHEQI